jgi:type I restriction enzyme R subunit
LSTLTDYSEDALIEKPAIALFKSLGYTVRNCFYETFGPKGTLGRETTSEVVLVRYLRPVLERLNPDLPPEAIDAAIEGLTRDRSSLSAASANRDVYRLLKDGVKVQIRTASGDEHDVRVQVIDWVNPRNNDLLLASQLWITGELYKRRADLVGFINGIPFLFIELKASHKRLEDAYRKNLTDYKDTIPQVFWFNGLIILSNGSLARVGSMTANWEHFAEWKKVSDEKEQGVVSLETVIRGTCDPARLLDLVENFTLFSEVKGGLVKVLAKNHQYLGVNNALEALAEIKSNQGRLGVFWHTQGSGKTISMAFFSQKVLRKVPGDYTFLVVTDRDDLDDQAYKEFAGSGLITEPEERVRAASGAHLKELLKEDHRYLFTLIQKFRTEGGATYPKLSDRTDVIVMADEAHRTQYDIFALNMRNALPKAAFIGFTGTPLVAGEEKTRQVFGDYVSVYNYKQSVDDQATVPLYYENRIPEVELTNAQLNAEMADVLDEADLDEAQERKLEREFSREYNLVTRDERLEKIAEDLVAHFVGRGYKGKAMVVSVDKATAVRMFDKVSKYWASYVAELTRRVAEASGEKRQELEAQLAYVKATDMAVVVSQSQNEMQQFRDKGLDILSHRKRMVTEDLATKFKDGDDPLRIVFVCAMWMTGFDVPSCSTIYLDKPMRNHTLMQTIARANRIFRDKQNGLIVDYIGVFRNIQRALAIYGSASGGGIKEGDSPIKAKEVLVGELRKAVDTATKYCVSRGIDLAKIRVAEGFDRVKALDDAVDALVVNDETKLQFLAHATLVTSLYRAVLPDPSANEFGSVRAALQVLAEKIGSLNPETDISEVMAQVDELLDRSVAATSYVIAEPAGTYGDKKLLDLSQVDFEALVKRFKSNHKHIEAERLKGLINQKLRQLVRLNRSRMGYSERFQQLIDEYNAGSLNVETFFGKLVEFAKELDEEEKRGIAESLSEEELAIFDLLTRPELKLTQAQEQQVKNVAQGLLQTLKAERLVLDWRKKQQSRAAVHLAIEEALDQLPETFDKPLYEKKVDLVYQHVYDSYFGSGRSVYAVAA